MKLSAFIHFFCEERHFRKGLNYRKERLREKLGPHAECIKTVIKAGYKLEV